MIIRFTYEEAARPYGKISALKGYIERTERRIKILIKIKEKAAKIRFMSQMRDFEEEQGMAYDVLQKGVEDSLQAENKRLRFLQERLQTERAIYESELHTTSNYFK
ncbi:MAG: hypothetical protein SPL86_09635 [Succiniclasticum sp.]|uniref:hypothetical protein n=1 Tax=Succiniclasticum sp. TaxID=2775030 RepID=UPI002A90AAED|nr:hypothetical protein [Succiniclasticum sp.]MDY6291730.1 hypothetical protein [Succiniclasticum sp.]